MPQHVHVGARTEAGWTTSAALAGAALPDALELVGRQLHTDRADIRGQRIIELVTWAVALPAAQSLLEDRLLDVGPDNTRIWLADEDAPDGIGTLVLDERYTAASLPQLQAYVDAHLTALVEATAALTLRPKKALWRGVKDRVAAALIWTAQMQGREADGCALAREADADVDLRTLELPGYALTVHVRSGCCLYYRIPEHPKCWGCPLLTDDERRALTTGG